MVGWIKEYGCGDGNGSPVLARTHTISQPVVTKNKMHTKYLINKLYENK